MEMKVVAPIRVGDMSLARYRPGQGYRACPQTCVYRKLVSAVVVMQAAEERMRLDASDPLNPAREGRVLV
jgi:hypothetical protein